MRASLENRWFFFCLMILFATLRVADCLEDFYDMQKAISSLLENEYFDPCDVIFFKDLDGPVPEDLPFVSIDGTGQVSPLFLRRVLKCPIIVFNTRHIDEVATISKKLPGSTLIGFGMVNDTAIEKPNFILEWLQAGRPSDKS